MKWGYFSITSDWKVFNFSGHIQETKGLPIKLERKKQAVAPAVALKTTKTRPLTTPKRAPPNNDKKTVPGIIKVCINM